MTTSMLRTRPETCLSDLAFDRLLVGEMAVAERADVDRHLAGCHACRARHAALVAFADEVAPVLRREAARAVVPLHRTALRRRALVALAPVLAAAALALVVVRAIERDDHRAPPEDRVITGDTRAKNGTSLDVIVRHADGRQALVLPGETLGAGDVLRFKLASDGGIAAIVAIDEGGVVSTYREPQPIAAGRDVVVDTAIALDDSHGVERIIAVVCDAPIAMPVILTAAREALTRAGGDPRRIDSLAGDPHGHGPLDRSCREATTWFVQR